MIYCLSRLKERNFNFPESSLPKGEGVGELTFPKSLPDVDPIVEVVSCDLPTVSEPVEPNDLISVAESSQIPSSECLLIRISSLPKGEGVGENLDTTQIRKLRR